MTRQVADGSKDAFEREVMARKVLQAEAAQRHAALFTRNALQEDDRRPSPTTPSVTAATRWGADPQRGLPLRWLRQ